MEFELLPEYISAIFVVVYIVNSLLDSKISTIQDVLYRISLYATLASIFFSVVSSYVVMFWFPVSYRSNVLINAAYFFFTFLMTTMLSLSMLAYMFEGRTQEKRFKTGFVVMLGLFFLSFAAVLLNFRTGWLFTVLPDGTYVRGPFNTMTYWLLLANAAVVIIAFLHERKRVRRSFKRIAITLPLITSVMAIYQVLFRNTLLTGSIATLALTTMLIYGQQQRIHVDHLTSLAGREIFYQTLERFAQQQKLFRVVFINLREYKAINNRYGQHAGDTLLSTVASYLSAIDRRIVACRFTGVEFALIIPDISEKEYAALFDALCTRFNEPWEFEDRAITLSASIIEIAYPEHAKTAGELISALEYAVRQAKASRHAGVVRFDAKLRNASGRFHYVLRQMTDTPDDRFYIVFQPLVDCKTGAPNGAEVLVRLRDENGRTIMPGEFIPLAEETGYVDAIDWFVLEKTCQFLRDHRDAGVAWLSVNLTPLVHGDVLVDRVTHLLDQYEISPAQLKLEVTERVFTDNLGLVDDTIRQLRALGVGVFLDDFGTGYSNLHKTFKLPFECIKIDRLFVSNVETDETARDFLAMLVSVLHSMHASVTVEGVETAAQSGIVQRLGADHIQGYYYAKPLPEDEYLAYLRSANPSANADS